jgi:hypothetical protein
MQSRDGFAQLRFDLLALQLLLFIRHFEHWPGLRIAATTIDGRIVEEGEQLVVVALRKRIELMVMAPAAVERHAEPHRSRGFGHVHHVVDAILGRDASAFAINHVVAAKACRQSLLVAGVGHQVSRDLPRRELVERHVGIK